LNQPILGQQRSSVVLVSKTIWTTFQIHHIALSANVLFRLTLPRTANIPRLTLNLPDFASKSTTFLGMKEVPADADKQLCVFLRLQNYGKTTGGSDQKQADLLFGEKEGLRCLPTLSHCLGARCCAP
jgi:hypothetical protein